MQSIFSQKKVLAALCPIPFLVEVLLESREKEQGKKVTVRDFSSGEKLGVMSCDMASSDIVTSLPWVPGQCISIMPLRETKAQSSTVAAPVLNSSTVIGCCQQH